MKYDKLPDLKILDEKEKVLREQSKEVTFPLSNEDKKIIEDSLTYLEMSQIDEYAEKYDLRAGWGLSLIQLGIKKRIFVIAEELEKGKFKRYVVINPKVLSHSEELVYVGEGEGCLSVNRDVEGIVPRYARMNVEAYDIDGNKYTIRVREELSICFQHEMDHLDGILFVDKIDKKNPYKNMNKMREI
ncbi:MAG: peptide deformylase [Bacilli bacterium]|nr:peptide deformylase [Bacilli bacterium]